MDKRETIENCIDEVNSVKDKLIGIMYELEECGAVRKANTLGTIIGKLEAWQHK